MTTSPVSVVPLAGEGAERRSSVALQMGGALWISHYALQLAMGLSSGKVQQGGVLGLLDGFCFLGAIFCFCLGLGLVSQSLWRQVWTAKVALVFAAIATFGVLGSVASIVIGRMPAIWGGLGVIGTCLSTTFVALAARRLQLWTPKRSLLLLLTGALTFPLILLFIIPGQFVPGFLTDELPFALSGAAFIAFARMGQK